MYWRKAFQTPRQRSGCYKRLALLRHKVWHWLRLQPQHRWLVGMITPLIIMLPGTFVCTSCQVAVVEWVGLFMPPLWPLILQGVSGQGADYIYMHAGPPCHAMLLHLTSSEDQPILFPLSPALFSIGCLTVWPYIESKPVSGMPKGLSHLQYERWKGVGSRELLDLLLWVAGVENLCVMYTSSAYFPSCSLSNYILSHRYFQWRAWRLLQ